MLDDIITDILKAEGWDTYTNDPADRGGPTKWGITLKAWQSYVGYQVTEGDIQEITEVQARKFYKDAYIYDPNFDQLDDILIPLVVDCGVNHGVSRATKWLQKAVGVTQDGEVGPMTIAASQDTSYLTVYMRICAIRARFYASIVSNDPSQAKFIKGWMNRGTKWLDRLASELG